MMALGVCPFHMQCVSHYVAMVTLAFSGWMKSCYQYNVSNSDQLFLEENLRTHESHTPNLVHAYTAGRDFPFGFHFSLFP